MRKFTLLVASAMLSLSAFAANDIVVNHQPDEKKVYCTFNDYSSVIPGTFMGNYSCTATLNDDDVTFYIYPTIDENEDFTNVIYFDYMVYFPALMNDGQLPDGDYTLTFNEGFLTYDFVSSNTEPVVVNFTVGSTVGINNVENQTSSVSYNLQGQKTNGTHGFSIVNGKKVLVK